MKKKFLNKYCRVLFLEIFLCLLVFGLFLGVSLDAYLKNEQKERLHRSAESVNKSVTAMLELSKEGFQYFLNEEKELLLAVLESQRENGELEIFITDTAGKILLKNVDGEEEKEFSADALAEGIQMARNGLVTKTDLDGFFSSPRMCRVILLERQDSEEPVGAVFFALSTQRSDRLFFVFLGLFFTAGFLIVLFAALTLGRIRRELILPLEELSHGAEHFSRGDFAYRMKEEKGGELTPILREYNQMAQKSEKSDFLRHSLVSNVAHDLRTPLTAIGGFIQNMLQGSISPDRYRHYFKVILSEVDRLSRLVQTLLSMGKMESGEREYRFAPTDLCEIGRITLLSFEQRIESHHIEVNFSAQEDSISVRADRDALQQVIYNLLDNAINFTPDGGELSVEILIQEKKALFSVKNTGEGIPKEEMSRLFERFYKGDSSRSLNKKGFGLGLFIVKSILDAHEEEIWVESREGSYTRFVFTMSLDRKSVV